MPTLLLSMGLLVLISVSSILALNWITGRSVVQEFATRLIARGLAIQEMALRRHLDAAVDQATSYRRRVVVTDRHDRWNCGRVLVSRCARAELS